MLAFRTWRRACFHIDQERMTLIAMAVLSVWEKASIIRLGLTDLTPTRLESTQLPKRVCHDFHESDKLPSFIQGYIHSACYELK